MATDRFYGFAPVKANEAEEYERWKVREIHRIKAYREEREKWQKEKDEILRRRCARASPWP